MQYIRTDLTLRTFVLALGVFLTAVLAYQLLPVITLLFLAFILYAGLKPTIDRLESSGMHRAFAIGLVYAAVIIVVAVLFSFIASELVTQIGLALKEVRPANFSQFINQYLPFLSGYISAGAESFSSSLVGTLSSAGTTGIALVSSIADKLLSFVIIVLLSIYMVGSRTPFYKGLLEYLPKQHIKRAGELMGKIEVGLGSWLLGQLFLMLVIGLASYIIVAVPAVFVADYGLLRFALLIAILAGILEALPNIGPILTVIIALVIAVFTGASLGVILYLVVAFTILQQLEGLFLVPQVMKKAVDLHPILSIVAIIAGFELAGVLGALLAIPLLGSIQIVVLNFIKKP